MISWQDPVALGLAALLVGAALWWRHWLIKRGSAPHCAQCKAGEQTPLEKAKPTVIDVSRMRMSKRR